MGELLEQLTRRQKAGGCRQLPGRAAEFKGVQHATGVAAAANAHQQDLNRREEWLSKRWHGLVALQQRLQHRCLCRRFRHRHTPRQTALPNALCISSSFDPDLSSHCVPMADSDAPPRARNQQRTRQLRLAGERAEMATPSPLPLALVIATSALCTGALTTTTTTTTTTTIDACLFADAEATEYGF